MSKGFFAKYGQGAFRDQKGAVNDHKQEITSDRFIPLRRGDISKGIYDTCMSKDSSYHEDSNSSIESQTKSRKILRDILRDNVLKTSLGYDSLGSRGVNYAEKKLGTKIDNEVGYSSRKNKFSRDFKNGSKSGKGGDSYGQSDKETRKLNHF